MGPVNSQIRPICKNDIGLYGDSAKMARFREVYLAVQGGYMTVQGGYMMVGGRYMHGVGLRDA